MGNPKKITIGQRLPQFPGGTFNALIEGELRDRQRRNAPPPPAVNSARSSVIVRLKWEGESQLKAGNVVKLGEALFDPTDDDSAPFTGLQFKCSEPADSDTDAHVAITPAPIEAGGVGFGAIPQAVWAKVDVGDEDHAFATVVEGTILESAGSGRFPIIWKPAGTGEKWAVVALSAIPSSSAELFVTTETITAGDYNGTTLTPGEGSAYKLVLDDPEADPLTWTKDDSTEFTLFNQVPETIPSGSVVTTNLIDGVRFIVVVNCSEYP